MNSIFDGKPIMNPSPVPDATELYRQHADTLYNILAYVIKRKGSTFIPEEVMKAHHMGIVPNEIEIEKGTNGGCIISSKNKKAGA